MELEEVLAVAHRECRAVIRLVGDDARMALVVPDCRAPQRCLFRDAEFISCAEVGCFGLRLDTSCSLSPP